MKRAFIFCCIITLFILIFGSCRKDTLNNGNNNTHQTPVVNVTTNNVSSITSNSVYLTGYLSYTGITDDMQNGFVIGLQPNPVTGTLPNFVFFGNMGSGSFGTTCSGLSSNTYYYARAFSYDACIPSDIWYGNNVTFTTSAGQSQICVWTSLSTFPCSSMIDVYIDDVYYGYLNQYYTSSPSCGNSGTVTVDVTPGSHKFYAKCNSGTTTWGPSYYTVGSGSCFKWQLN